MQSRKFLFTDPAGKNFSVLLKNDITSTHLSSTEISEVLPEISKDTLIMFDFPSKQEDQTKQLEILRYLLEIGSGVEVVFIADAFGNINRPYLDYFPEIRKRVNILLIPSPIELSNAKKRFPNAQTKVVGKPQWEQKTDLSLRDKTRKTIGVNKDDAVVLSPGTKFSHLNRHLWSSVLEGLKGFGKVHRSVRLLASFHPGELHNKNEGEYPYQEYPELVKAGVLFFTRNTLSSEELIPAADVTIGFLSAIAEQSAISGLPVIELRTGPLLERKAELLGDTEVPAVQSGAYLQVTSEDSLPRILGDIFDENSHARNKMRIAVRNTFPDNPPGLWIQKVRKTIST